jgi:hypothetical protein
MSLIIINSIPTIAIQKELAAQLVARLFLIHM